jgi:hypothetical protein
MISMGDFLFNLTEWLRTTPLLEFSLAITETGLNELMVTNFWAIPIAQFFHILGLAGSFGALVMITLRVFGLAGASMSMADTARRYTPWVWWSLLLLLTSGIFMTIGEPVREFINPIFWIKMLTLVFTLLISLWFLNGVIKKASVTGVVPGSARGGAIVMILLWCFLMLCGRWIAYAPV